MLRNVPLDLLRGNAERYRRLIRGEPIDYAPFRLWLDSTFVFWYTQVDPAEYARNLEVQLAAQKKVNDRFYDLRDFAVDVDLLDIYFDRDRFIADYHPAQPNRFLENDLDHFDRYARDVKAFEDLPSVRRLLEGIDFFNRNLPRHKWVGHYLGATGAMDLFSIFRGTEHFFMDLYDHSQKVKRIFEYLTERSLAWMEFAEKTWGGINPHNNLYDKVDIGEDYCAYLPPDQFAEFVVPYTGEIFRRYRGRVCCSLHTDGDFVARGIKNLSQLPLDELMGFSPNVDIHEYRRALPEVILAGNIHPIKVMIEGTPEEVKRAVRYCFDAAKQNQRFVLCTGGAITAGARPENIDAFIASIWEITRYDGSEWRRVSPEPRAPAEAGT